MIAYTWIEMKPISDRVVFADQEDPGFDRWEAWRAVLAGTHELELEDIIVGLASSIQKEIYGHPLTYWQVRARVLPGDHGRRQRR